MNLLSPNFAYAEAIQSQTATRRGLDNTPSAAHQLNMRLTALRMEIVRVLLKDKPILVSSWYRSPAVNAAVGGVENSSHAKGEAVDFICPGFGTPYEICEYLAKYKDILNYDQLIYEGTWVHIAFTALPTRKPRLQELTWMQDKSYRAGILKERS